MNEHLQRAREALETAAVELRQAAGESAVRARLRRAAEEVLAHLEAEDQAAPEDDVMTRIDRKSREIAEELRRVERLMKQRTGEE